MADIPADAGVGLGAFENVGAFDGGAAFASHLGREVQQCYGAVGRAFLAWACKNTSGLGVRVRRAADALAAAWTPANASGQVQRVASRFAIVGAAGELATEAGLTGWPSGESERGARSCFEAWLAARGGAGSGEVTAMLRQVRRFLEAHGEGRFTWWHRAADDHNAKTLMRAGFRRMVDSSGKPIKSNSDHQREFGERMHPIDGEGVSVDYFILTEVFRTEVCAGFDHLAVCKALIEQGCLVPDGGRKYDCRPRIPGLGGKVTCYQINSQIFETE